MQRTHDLAKPIADGIPEQRHAWHVRQPKLIENLDGPIGCFFIELWQIRKKRICLADAILPVFAR